MELQFLLKLLPFMYVLLLEYCSSVWSPSTVGNITEIFHKKTHCNAFNPHYGELLYVFMFLLLMWIDELNK